MPIFRVCFSTSRSGRPDGEARKDPHGLRNQGAGLGSDNRGIHRSQGREKRLPLPVAADARLRGLRRGRPSPWLETFGRMNRILMDRGGRRTADAQAEHR